MGVESWRSSPVFQVSVLVLVGIHACLTSAATDTISLGEPLSGNQTIVSSGGNFVLGFFSPGESSKSYIGIWYKKVSKQTAIWVANRESPITNTTTSQLKISEDGNLILLNHHKIPIWSSKLPSPASKSTVAVLLDTGNLVLREHSNSSAVIWQSFDHPTDTWVPKSWIGLNKVTGEYQTLTSWKNSQDPAPGYFSDTIDHNGTSEFFYLWNQSVVYGSSGIWMDYYFAKWPLYQEMSRANPINMSFVDDKQRRGVTSSLQNSSVHSSTIIRTVMDVSGQLLTTMWVDNTQQWLLINALPSGICESYSLCGPYGVCNQRSQPTCSCSPGFKPSSERDWELKDWSSGCERSSHLNCFKNSSEKEDGFMMMPNMRLPVNPQSLTISNAEDCRAICLANCSCTAYSYDQSTGCSIWRGELRNLQQLSGRDDGAALLYLRLASSSLVASEMPHYKDKRKNVAGIVSAAACGAVAVIIIILSGLAWSYHKRKMAMLKHLVEGSLVPFTYAEMQRMTKRFSEKLGGGGFGSVFKGQLPPDSSAVAVKKLEGRRQGEKQFRAEVSTLGLIQHANLIRLRGFCAEENHRMLVYDYMPNGSLNGHLFGKDSTALDWRTRYNIILGVARGLFYLHEKCRECIIHCDIKPENILLDSNFSPKVADFGLAKLVGRDFSRVLTTMRGTIGYLAPEWISGLPITPKADVYSFGMTLFELLSGRRNTEGNGDDETYFPVMAAIGVVQGELHELLDDRLQGNADMEEVSRVCKVACWCIQDREAQRPSMGEVVQILEGAYQVNMPPIPRSLQHLARDGDMPIPPSTEFFSAESCIFVHKSA